MVRLGSSSSSSSSRRSSRQSGGGRNSSGGSSSGRERSSNTGRPRLAKSGKSRNLLLEPTYNNTKKSSKPTKSNSSKNKNGTGNPRKEAAADPEAEVDLHALRRLHRHERTLDIPTTLSIVPFPSTPYVDPTHLDHSAGMTSGTTTTNMNAVTHKTPYGGRMIAGTTAEPTPGPTGRMRRADAGHTPGGIYLPPALLPSTSATMGVHTHLPTVPWDDGVSPLAFGAEARPVRTEREQQAMEEEERRMRKERERRREALLEYDENGGGSNIHNEEGGGGGGMAKKSNDKMKGQKKKGNKGRRGKSQRRSKSGGGQKRSEAYEVNADGLLVVKSSKSSDSGGDSSGSGSGPGTSSGATKSKSRARSKAKAGKKKSSLRTLGKAGIRSLRRGGAKSRKATIAAAIVVKTKVVTAMNHGNDGDDDNDNDTIRRSKSNDGSLKTPAMPAEMARRVDDGEAVAPYSTLAPTATTSTSHTPVRHPRQPVPLHNFRRLSMIDASEQNIPTTVKRRVAAAKAKAVAAGSAGIAAGAVGGSAAATLAYEGARVGGARVMGSAKKVGRSATKSMARLRRRIVDNVNAAGYAVERREFGTLNMYSMVSAFACFLGRSLPIVFHFVILVLLTLLSADSSSSS